MMERCLQSSCQETESIRHVRLIHGLSRALRVIIPLLILVLALAIWLIVQAPNDYQHGVTGKILYLHVPSAWLATLCYSWMVACALVVIFLRWPMARQCLATAAPLGGAFTGLTLVTGSLWGRAAWGTWWVWDARLSAVFVLFMIYLAIIGLGFFDRRSKQQGRFVAILTLFGFVVVPIIKFSTQWWHSLHQPTSIWRASGPAIEMEMLVPLITMAMAFILLFIALHLLALRAQLLSQYLHVLQFPSQSQTAYITPTRLPILASSEHHLPKCALKIPPKAIMRTP